MSYSPVNSYDERQGVGSIKEDLWDLISNVESTEFQLQSGLGNIDVYSTRHEWLVDTLAAGNTNVARAEGFTPDYADVTNTTRIANYLQTIDASVKVTDRMKAVRTAGQFSDDMARQKANAIKVLKNRIEYALMAGTIATGSSTVASGMAGIKDVTTWGVSGYEMLTTNTSGTSLSETMFNDYLANNWDGTAEVPQEAFMGAAIKRRISGFTAGSTKNTDNEDKRLVNAVDVYESDFGIIKLFLHRYANAGATNNDLVLVNPDFAKIGFLRRPEYVETAKTGDATQGYYVADLTLQVSNPKTHQVVKNIL